MREEAIERASYKLLRAMYASVERMNQHVLDGNSEGVVCEQVLQIHLHRDLTRIKGRE